MKFRPKFRRKIKLFRVARIAAISRIRLVRDAILQISPHKLGKPNIARVRQTQKRARTKVASKAAA